MASTAMSLPDRRAALTAVPAARALLAAVLAAVVTFTRNDHNPRFGLVVLGVFAVVQAAPMVAGAVSLAVRREGRVSFGVRAALTAAIGVAALVRPDGGLALLVPLEAVLFLAVGALEVVSGVRRAEATPVGDTIVVGGLQVLVGVMLVVLDRDAVFTVGVLGAWGAVVAVYLGIAAVSARRTVQL